MAAGLAGRTHWVVLQCIELIECVLLLSRRRRATVAATISDVIGADHTPTAGVAAVTPLINRFSDTS